MTKNTDVPRVTDHRVTYDDRLAKLLKIGLHSGASTMTGHDLPDGTTQTVLRTEGKSQPSPWTTVTEEAPG